MDEVLHAVEAHGGEGWLSLARSATGPTSSPLDVALSRLWLRLLEGEDGTQRELAILEVVVPTGC